MSSIAKGGGFKRTLDDRLNTLNTTLDQILNPSNFNLIESDSNLDGHFERLATFLDENTDSRIDLRYLCGPFERLLFTILSSTKTVKLAPSSSWSVNRLQEWAWKKLAHLQDWFPTLSIDERLLTWSMNRDHTNDELVVIARWEYLAATASHQGLTTATVRRLIQSVIETLEEESISSSSTDIYESKTKAHLAKKGKIELKVKKSHPHAVSLPIAALQWVASASLQPVLMSSIALTLKERLFLAIWKKRANLPIDRVLTSLTGLVMGHQPAVLHPQLPLLMHLVRTLLFIPPNADIDVNLQERARQLARQIDLLIRPRRSHLPEPPSSVKVDGHFCSSCAHDTSRSNNSNQFMDEEPKVTLENLNSHSPPIPQSHDHVKQPMLSESTSNKPVFTSLQSSKTPLVPTIQCSTASQITLNSATLTMSSLGHDALIDGDVTNSLPELIDEMSDDN